MMMVEACRLSCFSDRNNSLCWFLCKMLWLCAECIRLCVLFVLHAVFRGRVVLLSGRSGKLAGLGHKEGAWTRTTRLSNLSQCLHQWNPSWAGTRELAECWVAFLAGFRQHQAAGRIPTAALIRAIPRGLEVEHCNTRSEQLTEPILRYKVHISGAQM